MKTKVFVSPSRYVQGAGAMNVLGEELTKFGHNPFIISDKNVWGIAGEKVTKSLEKEKISFNYEEFSGESSNAEIERLTESARNHRVDIVLGVGGGKTLDTAKGIADQLGVPVAVAPTTASTDAPTSALSVIYSDEGVFEGYKFYNKNPDLVVMDSEIIVGAPVSFLAAGMGDAMATLVEARAANKRNSDTMAGGKATLAALAIAEAAEKVLFEQGISAYKAAEKGIVTPQVDAVIEANTLLSGLGFENGGIAAAHAIHNGFTALDGEVHNLSHGQKVAYGILTQLVLEGETQETLMKYLNFFKAIKLPTTLKELHLEDAPFEDLVKVGELATSEGETLQNFDPSVTATEVANAIIAVDALSAE